MKRMVLRSGNKIETAILYRASTYTTLKSGFRTNGSNKQFIHAIPNLYYFYSSVFDHTVKSQWGPKPHWTLITWTKYILVCSFRFESIWNTITWVILTINGTFMVLLRHFWNLKAQSPFHNCKSDQDIYFLIMDWEPHECKEIIPKC